MLLGLINNALLLLLCNFECLGSSVGVVTKQRIFSCSAQLPYRLRGTPSFLVRGYWQLFPRDLNGCHLLLNVGSTDLVKIGTRVWSAWRSQPACVVLYTETIFCRHTVVSGSPHHYVFNEPFMTQWLLRISFWRSRSLHSGHVIFVSYNSHNKQLLPPAKQC
jgi:hypothetical protein